MGILKTRQQMIDERWNQCFICKKQFIAEDKIVCFTRQTILVPWPMMSPGGFGESVVIYGNDIFKHQNLKMYSSLHQSCFVSMAGEQFSFWEEDWEFSE